MPPRRDTVMTAPFRPAHQRHSDHGAGTRLAERISCTHGMVRRCCCLINSRSKESSTPAGPPRHCPQNAHAAPRNVCQTASRTPVQDIPGRYIKLVHPDRPARETTDIPKDKKTRKWEL